jgi:chromosome segregation ATPase
MSDEQLNDVKEQPEKEAPAEDKKQDAQWDKERQKVDQAVASVQKLSTKLESVETEKGQLAERLEALEQKLAEQKKEDGLALEKVDEDLVGRSVSKNFEVLSAKYEQTAKKLAALEAKAEALEKQRKVDKEAQQKQKTIDRIHKPLDKKYGAKFRNEAQKLAEKKIAEGKAEHPHDQEKAAEKPSPGTDTGEGGLPWEREGVKTGSLDEVFDDIAKKGIK